ncbi:hypothetical protein KUTeg_000961 [Tegillarca granosa]|uniref:G-protein coupled receptors family 1 profile domain-containing protein n=1 Tax=Tegillarca granosa TaxID=220873 RepID=A0ABQ9FZC2_TEGGR|nr:hypothetical protein KUTeg_000961 [Tegillarca granosa]
MDEIQSEFKDILPYSGYMIIGTILTFATILGSFLNFVSIFIFYKRRILRRPTNYFVMNLAVLDFIMSIFGIPMAAVASFNTRWIFCQKGCIYYGFLMTFIGLNNITILSVIAVSRYIVIVKPQYRIHKRSAIILILASCFSSFVMAAFPLIGWSSYTLEGAGTSCSVNWRSNGPKDVSINLVLIILYYLIPIAIFLFSYISIYKKVKTDMCNQSQVSGRNTNAEYDVAKVMLVCKCF